MSSDVNLNTVVVFGKYKGKSLEVMMADRTYCEWIATQDGIRERWPQIVEFVLTGSTGANETPEHNRIQAMFLYEGFRHKIIAAAGAAPSVDLPVKFEQYGFDVQIESGNQMAFLEIKPCISDDYPVILRQMKMACNIVSAARIVYKSDRFIILYALSVKCKHVSEEDVRRIFACDGIIVVTAAQIGVL